jgi:hypothetical protein
MKIDFKEKFKLRTLEIVLIAIGAVLYAVFSVPTIFVIAFKTGGPIDIQFRPAVIIPSAMAVLFGPLVGGFSAGIGTTIASAVKHGVPSPATIFGGLPGNFLCYFVIGIPSGFSCYQWRNVCNRLNSEHNTHVGLISSSIYNWIHNDNDRYAHSSQGILERKREVA